MIPYILDAKMCELPFIFSVSRFYVCEHIFCIKKCFMSFPLLKPATHHSFLQLAQLFSLKLIFKLVLLLINI